MSDAVDPASMEVLMTMLSEDQDQLEALYHLLVQARTGLEKIDTDSDGSTAYMHARNARIAINEALRRLGHLMGNTDSYPVAESDQLP